MTKDRQQRIRGCARTRYDKGKLERGRNDHSSLLFISPELLQLNLAVREMLYI